MHHVRTKLCLSVLVYLADDCWVAVAVYVDLVGVGTSRSEALANLAQTVVATAVFAAKRNRPPLRLRSAQGRWDESHLETLELMIDGDTGDPSLWMTADSWVEERGFAEAVSWG